MHKCQKKLWNILSFFYNGVFQVNACLQDKLALFLYGKYCLVRLDEKILLFIEIVQLLNF